MSKQSGQVSLAKDYLRGATKQLEKARAAGVDLSALVPLLTALIELAAEVLPGALKRDELGDAMDRAVETLPAGYSVVVRLERARWSVGMVGPKGDEYWAAMDSLPETINTAVDRAITSALTPRG